MNIVNTDPYLRTSRDFPKETEKMREEVDKAYIDTANAINNRTIGIYSKNRPSVTGESWFITSEKQQTLRKIFTFENTSSMLHNLDIDTIPYFTEMRGQYTDGINWFGLLAGTSVAVSGLISFHISGTNIVFLSGAGAPSLTKGIIVLEWLSNV